MLMPRLLFPKRLEGSRFGVYPPGHPHEFVSAYYKDEPMRATGGSRELPIVLQFCR